MTDIKLTPSSVAAFTEALKGESGSLDAWLEVNDESEVAAHIEAYASACVSSATAEKDAEIERLRKLCRDMLPVFEAARPLVLNLERMRDAAKEEWK